MNCEDFNKIIDELADYKPMEATIRNAGVSHIALCAGCAVKLASARAVSTSLIMAAGAESEAAPTKVKQNLLAAFAALQAEPVKPRGAEAFRVVENPAVEKSMAEMSRDRRRRGWTAAGAAVGAMAAVILLAVTVPSWIEAPETLPPVADLKAPIEDSRTLDVIVDKGVVSPDHENDKEKPGATVNPVPARRRSLRKNIPDTRGAKGTDEAVAQKTGEYLPLTYLARSTAIDSGTIVRVELSRAALASLGLSLNLEGTGALVKADVVIGDDGVAQAIRVVQ